MTLLSADFEQNIIKSLIGLIFLVVGAYLISSGGYIAVGPNPYIPVSIVLFVVGAVLIYFAVKVFASILETMGVRLWKER